MFICLFYKWCVSWIWDSKWKLMSMCREINNKLFLVPPSRLFLVPPSSIVWWSCFANHGQGYCNKDVEQWEYIVKRIRVLNRSKSLICYKKFLFHIVNIISKCCLMKKSLDHENVKYLHVGRYVWSHEILHRNRVIITVMFRYIRKYVWEVGNSRLGY
jgi:hypothetical protein